MELLELIKSRYSRLSKNQRKVADYIAANGIDASLDSISELAGKIGVSEASIVRFAQQLGHKGYLQLRKELQAGFRRNQGSVSRFRDAVADVSRDSLLSLLLRRDVQLIEETLNSLPVKDFDEAVAMISRARRIFIIGFTSAYALAYFLYFRLVRLRFDVRLISFTGGTALIEQLALLAERDLLIALGFDNLPVETRTAMDFARKQKVLVLGITHTPTAEIARKANVSLLARRKPHRTQSLAAAMSLLNALAIAVAAREKSRTIRALRRLDTMEQAYIRRSK